jgi:hypothetical protein
MNASLKKLAVAASVAALVPTAHAAINPGLDGNGELWVSLIDEIGLRSYTRDLGITIDDFVSVATPTAAGVLYSFAPDPLLTSFLGGTANPAALKWNIGAMDILGRHRFLTTAAAMPGPSGAEPTQTNGQLRTYDDGVAIFIANTNSEGTHPPINDYSVHGSNIFVAVTGSEAAYAGGPNWGASWGIRANFSTLADFGSSNSFFLLEHNGTNVSSNAIRYLHSQFGNNLGPGAWAFDPNGTLTYTQPIPEPGTWAMLIAGLIGIGAIARRRTA